MELPDFEDEIVSFGPDRNYVFDEIQRPPVQRFRGPRRSKESLKQQEEDLKKRNAKNEKNLNALQQKEEEEYPDLDDKLSENEERIKHEVLSVIRRIAGLPPIEVNDTRSESQKEQEKGIETLAMIRYCGMGSGGDFLNKGDFDVNNLPPSKDIEYIYSGQGKEIPLFLHEKYFKLLPRSEIERINNIDAEDWNKFVKPNGQTDIRKLKAELEAKQLPLAQRVARLNNLPEHKYCNPGSSIETKAPSRYPAFESLNNDKNKIPWSERKNKSSKAYQIAMSYHEPLPPSSNASSSSNHSKNSKQSAMSFSQILKGEEKDCNEELEESKFEDIFRSQKNKHNDSFHEEYPNDTRWKDAPIPWEVPNKNDSFPELGKKSVKTNSTENSDFDSSLSTDFTDLSITLPDFSVTTSKKNKQNQDPKQFQKKTKVRYYTPKQLYDMKRN